MPVDFLSDTLREVLICSPLSQNDGARQWNCARNSLGLRGSFYYSSGLDIEAHDTEIKQRICESAYKVTCICNKRKQNRTEGLRNNTHLLEAGYSEKQHDLTETGPFWVWAGQSLRPLTILEGHISRLNFLLTISI
jgi:hypothetical protein